MKKFVPFLLVTVALMIIGLNCRAEPVVISECLEDDDFKVMFNWGEDTIQQIETGVAGYPELMEASDLFIIGKPIDYRYMNDRMWITIEIEDVLSSGEHSYVMGDTITVSALYVFSLEYGLNVVKFVNIPNMQQSYGFALKTIDANHDFYELSDPLYGIIWKDVEIFTFEAYRGVYFSRDETREYALGMSNELLQRPEVHQYIDVYKEISDAVFR